MKNFSYILDEIALAAVEVNKSALAMRDAAMLDRHADARAHLSELVRVQRQLTAMVNIVRDVVDAMDAAPVAEGDLDAAHTVYQEASV